MINAISSVCFVCLFVLFCSFQTRNPYAVQPHLRKCFDAIAKLEFGKGGATSGILEGEESDKLSSDIVAMISPEGERISLTKVLISFSMLKTEF